MRFGPDTLDMLVRPRVLSAAAIFPIKSGRAHEFTFNWAKTRKVNRFDRFSMFAQTPGELFSELELGDSSENVSNCYVGVVSHYIVKIAGQMSLVDKANVTETLKRVRKLLGARTNLRVVSVGVQFYKGMERDEQGKLTPVKPWNPRTSSGEETIWFFNPWELVPMDEIIKYESVRKGDLILFQKARGLVVRKKLLNKPKFYNTSSWSSYSITLLNFTADGFTRFLPDRKFTVRRSGDPLPPDPARGEDQPTDGEN